jgi:metal transporter CNNM
MLLSGLIVVILILFSAVCSGLNIGLMSLKLTDLKHKAQLGDHRAIRVLPFRLTSHLTLASILIANVAVISATSLVLEQYINGFFAGIISTLLIVIFGEVIPQALFLSDALAYSALLSPVLRLIIIATYPVSKLLQILLDSLLGAEHSPLQTRQELGLVIGEHESNDDSELDDNELDIMRGALSLSEKRVREIMTPLSKVYWLTPSAVLDATTIDELKAQNFSRIPVLNKRRTEALGVILMKDLVDLNFDDRSFQVSELRLHPTKTVGSMTALDTLFRKFINAHSHLMPVERDDKIVGIVTVEDLIEEIIGHEIEDESDHDRRNRTPSPGKPVQ